MENLASVFQVLGEVLHSGVENVMERTLPNVEARNYTKDSSVRVLILYP